MEKNTRTALLAAALIAGAGHAQAQRSLRDVVSPGGPGGEFGRVVEAMGDVNGDGLSDYAVAGPRMDVAGVDAGGVYVYSGLDGTLLWSFLGTAGPGPCANPNEMGDRMGWDMELVADHDGDGIDDLAVSAIFSLGGEAQCREQQLGQYFILSGAGESLVTGTGSVLLTQVGEIPGSQLGLQIQRTPPVNNTATEDNYLVLRRGAVEYVFTTPTSTMSSVVIPLPPSEFVVSSAGNFFGGPWNLAFAFGDPSNSSVRVWDPMQPGTQQLVFQGPANSGFGSVIELVPNPNGAPNQILVGAPQQGASGGAVYLLDANGMTQLSVGTVGDRLGASIAPGGNSSSGSDFDDVLVGAPGGNYVRIMDISGALIEDIPGSTGSMFGTSVAWIEDLIGNNQSELLVGDRGAFNGTGRAEVLLGGPLRSVNQAFTVGCNPLNPPPVLTYLGDGSMGSSASFEVGVFPGNSNGDLLWGLPNVNGIVYGTCTSALDPGFGEWIRESFTTNNVGYWMSAPIPVPSDPILIGQSIVHQALFDRNTPNAFLTNSVVVTIGW